MKSPPTYGTPNPRQVGTELLESPTCLNPPPDSLETYTQMGPVDRTAQQRQGSTESLEGPTCLNQGNQGAQGTQGNQGNQGLQYNFFLQGNQYSLGGSATGVQNVPGLQTGTLVNGAQYIVSAQIGTQCAVGTQGLQFALQCSVASATVSGSALGNQAAAVGGAAVLADQTISAQGVQGPVSTMFTGLGWYEVNAFVLTPGTGSPYIGIQAKGVQSGGNTWVKANSYMSVIRIA